MNHKYPFLAKRYAHKISLKHAIWLKMLINAWMTKIEILLTKLAFTENYSILV